MKIHVFLSFFCLFFACTLFLFSSFTHAQQNIPVTIIQDEEEEDNDEAGVGEDTGFMEGIEEEPEDERSPATEVDDDTATNGRQQREEDADQSLPREGNTQTNPRTQEDNEADEESEGSNELSAGNSAEPNSEESLYGIYFYFVRARAGGQVPSNVLVDYSSDGEIDQEDRTIIVDALKQGQMPVPLPTPTQEPESGDEGDGEEDGTDSNDGTGEETDGSEGNGSETGGSGDTPAFIQDYRAALAENNYKLLVKSDENAEITSPFVLYYENGQVFRMDSDATITNLNEVDNVSTTIIIADGETYAIDHNAEEYSMDSLQPGDLDGFNPLFLIVNFGGPAGGQGQTGSSQDENGLKYTQISDDTWEVSLEDNEIDTGDMTQTTTGGTIVVTLNPDTGLIERIADKDQSSESMSLVHVELTGDNIISLKQVPEDYTLAQ